MGEIGVRRRGRAGRGERGEKREEKGGERSDLKPAEPCGEPSYIVYASMASI